MGTTGMYKEALELLGQIDKKTLPDYSLWLLLSFVSHYLRLDGRLCRYGESQERVLSNDGSVS